MNLVFNIDLLMTTKSDTVCSYYYDSGQSMGNLLYKIIIFYGALKEFPS